MGRLCFHRCLSFYLGKGGPHVTIIHDALGHSYPQAPRYQTWNLHLPLSPDMGPTPLLLTSGGHHWRPVQTCLLENIAQLVLTPSDNHRNMYCWQAVSTHPTGMPSCLLMSTDSFFCDDLFNLTYLINSNWLQIAEGSNMISVWHEDSEKLWYVGYLIKSIARKSRTLYKNCLWRLLQDLTPIGNILFV